MERAIAFDFDGVISDSAPEAFLVALRAYVELEPESPLRDSALRLGADGAPPLERVEAEPLYAGFVEHMPLGNRAEDYGVVMAALECGASLPDQAAYDAFRTRRDESWLRIYHGRFYEIRAALARVDAKGWQALMKPYPELVALLRRRAGDAELAIATAKDRASVRALLRLYGLADLFPEDRVLDKETGVSKSAHLEHLSRALDLPFPAIRFVDDKVNHLDAVAPLGVRCALATWGYNGARELVQAEARGHLVCTLANAEEQLFVS